MDVSELIRNEDFDVCKEKGKLWISINNSVYDISDFFNKHPGGEEVILEFVGKDATEAFEDVGHSTDAKELLKKYKIGELVDSETDLKEKDSSTTASNEALKIGLSGFKYILLTLLTILIAIFCYEFLNVLFDY